ncbi:MAG: class I SAM-dependent methyltransferase [Deltaproteobacteria bacterium]|nr:class I SAM-dependent methyltransferase [Deltaproteobacteria bacterium]
MKEVVKDRWEDFHQVKEADNMALEWPDDYVVRYAKRWLKQVDIRKVLDMNCGAGRHTALLAELGYETVGCDISEAALQLARKLLVKRGVQASLHQGNSLELPFSDISFDALVAWRSLHVFSFDDIPKVLSEMRRVVRPGGNILFSTRSDRNIYDETRLSTIVHKPTDLTLEQIEALCSGFQVQQIELSEFTANNRQLRDSYWVVALTR